MSRKPIFPSEQKSLYSPSDAKPLTGRQADTRVVQAKRTELNLYSNRLTTARPHPQQPLLRAQLHPPLLLLIGNQHQ